MVVAFPAALKADTFHLPVDRKNLPERLEWTIQESGARVPPADREIRARGLPSLDTVVITDEEDLGAPPAPVHSENRDGRSPRNWPAKALHGSRADLLGASAVGIEDGFVEPGGQSVPATHLANRARSATAAELPIRTHFETPTVTGPTGSLSDTRKAGRPILKRRPSTGGGA
ncbi:hypothetical protein [Streptomyces prunicolor]|uniref:Uncharacterized protein n=1 Tax=Streptomyces prunicolor TaxID=67348 RepID=A0ABU4FP62_9ACTN|nr:hypothetical protein [Streptomyces prunicolor]MDV7222404.1 hypothetical protein [Streptomyces prunicolor]